MSCTAIAEAGPYKSVNRANGALRRNPILYQTPFAPNRLKRYADFYADPNCNFAAKTTFSSSIATVIGPKPPGTGVIADAFSRAAT